MTLSTTSAMSFCGNMQTPSGAVSTLPDINLKIISREQNNKNVNLERLLGPEEPIGQTLDAYYPGGQQVDEALVIDIPLRRTPRASPRAGNHHVYYYPDQYRPDEAAREYFPSHGGPLASSLSRPSCQLGTSFHGCSDHWSTATSAESRITWAEETCQTEIWETTHQ